MDPIQDLIEELRSVTRELVSVTQLDSDTFAQLLRRRGELIHRLCGGVFDPSDIRVQAILRDGDYILDRAHMRQDLLRTEASSMELLTAFCGGIRSTIPQGDPAGVDIIA
ncbi:MAG TPA: hypothetical protein VK789_18115 [Bryobacteraceae bacterium]|jgi:hypothetical protein|nr:hypothetical protein [Bryobacteraceae bacterium]